MSARATVEALRAQLSLLTEAGVVEARTAHEQEADRVGASIFGDRWPEYLAALLAYRWATR